MYFNENIRVLRKKKGYSQEQLAQELDVSRQAVSKWESEGAYPEMTTLLQICELFEVSMDDLIKKNLAYQSIGKDEDSIYCLSFLKTCSKTYAIGVSTIIMGVALQPILKTFFPEQSKLEFIPTSIFLMFIMVGVSTLIFMGMKDDHFKKKYPTLPVTMLNDSEKEKLHQSFTIAIASGVGLILLGLILQITIEKLYFEGVANTVFLSLVACAVFLFICFGSLHSRIEEAGSSQEEKKKEIDKENKIGAICGIIMICATIIFFISGFLFDAWKLCWLVFPIGGMLCGITAIIIETFSKS